MNSNTYKYNCEKCNYNTNKKQDYDKHLLTKKHLDANLNNVENVFICNICNKTYLYQSGLCKHKKKCKEIKEVKIDFSNKLMNTIIIQNKEQNKEIKELKNMIIQLSNKSSYSNNK